MASFEAEEPPAVCMEQVSAGYGGGWWRWGRRRTRATLHQVDLRVARGEIVALVGPNGAGKSTCLKALLDLCRPVEGRIAIFGVPHHHPAARRRVAFLPESFDVPPGLTGRTFLRFMARLHGMHPDEATLHAAANALAVTPEMLRRPIRQCSKGTGQRIGLAACLLANADLIVLDEPMNGLDPGARHLAHDALRAARARGAAILMATHLLADLDQLCDRIVLLAGGQIRFDGTLERARHVAGAPDLASAWRAWFT